MLNLSQLTKNCLSAMLNLSQLTKSCLSAMLNPSQLTKSCLPAQSPLQAPHVPLSRRSAASSANIYLDPHT